jgi:hypothetical protein
MPTRDQCVVEIMDAIHEILINDWDPIGVMADPEWPRDEYNVYVGQIYRFLVRGESAKAIARHLCFVESERMGLRVPEESSLMGVAHKLKAIDISVKA